jgi:hypothetical protein
VIKPRKRSWAGHVAHTGKIRNAHKILVGKYEGKRQLGRPKHRLEDNTKMDHKK